MSSSMAAIHNDIERYLALCRQYKELPEYSAGSPDCYGGHALALERRSREAT